MRTDFKLSNPSSCPLRTTHPRSRANRRFPSITNATCLGTGPARRIRRMSDWKWDVMLEKMRDGLKRWRRWRIGCGM